MLSFLNVEKEFEAQTFRIDSTHEYFKTCEYELLTPPELGDRSLQNFQNSIFFKQNGSDLLAHDENQ